MAFVIGNFDAQFLPDDVKTALDEDVPMYGVKFSTSSLRGIRTYDAATLNWSISTNTIRGVDDFANLPPFNVKECVTKFNSSTGEREVLAYKGDSGYASAKADTDADVMIEVPCFWYKRPSKWEWIVAPRAKAGFKPSPMHYRNGRLYDKVRVTKYNISTNYTSQVDEAPVVSQTLDTFRAKLREKGMYIMDYNTWCSLTMLMLVKYSYLGVSDIFGNGPTSISSSGQTDGILGLDGVPTSISANESMLTFGIENFYGNVLKIMDGIFICSGNVYYKDVESMSIAPVNESELISSYTLIANSPAVQGWISDISFDSGNDWLIIPISVTDQFYIDYHIGDYIYAHGNNSYIYIFRMGGAYRYGKQNGLFFHAFNGYPANYSDNETSILGIEF